jgi:chromosomal replication initiator protein
VDDPVVLWKACADVLRDHVSEAVWLTIFQHVEPLAFDGATLTLAVPSQLVKERIESRYEALIVSALADVDALGVGLAIEVRPGAALEGPDGADLDPDQLGATAASGRPPVGLDAVDGPGPAGAALAATDSSADAAPPLGVPDTRYTFDDFVTGTSNRFAHAAALSVAETPAKSYNPLFIYGDAGLGKTHLLQAISHYVSEHYPNYRVLYVSTETFLNQFVDMIRSASQAEFKRRYRAVDVLLIDDIQFIEGHEQLQVELFHTFNDLYDARRQIVLSSDRPPDKIPTLEDRLRSRFMMGLMVDIQPPDLETRLAILRKKAEAEAAVVPDDVMNLIATHVTDNIRELEGALIRVCAYAALNKEQLDLSLAENVLADLLTNTLPRPITPELIMTKTSDMYGFTIEDLCGKSRRRPLVTARQVGMYVFRELTDMSYPQIAREFGGRDHTTVIHAVEKIRAQMKENRKIYDQVTELTQSIKSGS